MTKNNGRPTLSMTQAVDKMWTESGYGFNVPAGTESADIEPFLHSVITTLRI